MGHLTLIMPLLGWFVIHQLGYDIVYMCIKFDDAPFGRFRDVVGGHQNLNGSRDLTTPLSWMSSVG